MEHDEITRQTMSAFEDLMTDEERVALADDPDPGDPDEELRRADDDEIEQPVDDEEPEEEEQDEGEADEDEEQDESEEEEPDEEEEEEEVAAEYSPDVAAFLAKYDGDLDAALKGASELYHLMNRQGQEKNAALARVEELESELARAQAFRTGTPPLSEEQRVWVEEASGSANPASYVQMAVDAGEFNLARAVCEQWAHEDPYNAARVGLQIDQIEQQSNVEPEPTYELSRMLEAAREQFPDMPVYWGQMTRLIAQLGDNHHLVIAARSNDVNEAARGIVGLYDMAKATAVNVRVAKEKVKATKRREGVAARQEAQVSSAATSPSRSQTPRRREIMPGLTAEELEAAFAE